MIIFVYLEMMIKLYFQIYLLFQKWSSYQRRRMSRTAMASKLCDTAVLETAVHSTTDF